MQTTIQSAVTFSGIGLHTGQRVRMTVRPAPAGHGVRFRRTDVIGCDAVVPAHFASVVPSRLCTLVGNGAGVTVSTIEHIMAALAGCGLHNVLIDIDGPEVPILDGSAAPFVAGLMSRGLAELDAPVRGFEVLARVEVTEGSAIARLDPAPMFEIDFSIDFSDAAIGRQRKRLTLSNGTFVRELCDSRTFCRQQDVEAMRANGLALGGTYENAVVVDGGAILSPGGFRHPDEAVRHKMLDALGDLSLAGGPIFGRYTGIRAGHALTNRLLRELFGTPGAVRMVEVQDERRRVLPGAGLVAADIPAVA
ncbi:MAG: UDP-3-O-acyl-N-acetylglucosamine deacetylase [Pseudomonadota bacterium]